VSEQTCPVSTAVQSLSLWQEVSKPDAGMSMQVSPPTGLPSLPPLLLPLVTPPPPLPLLLATPPPLLLPLLPPPLPLLPGPPPVLPPHATSPTAMEIAAIPRKPANPCTAMDFTTSPLPSLLDSSVLAQPPSGHAPGKEQSTHVPPTQATSRAGQKQAANVRPAVAMSNTAVPETLTGIPPQSAHVPLQTCPTAKLVQSELTLHAVVYADAGMYTHAAASPTPASMAVVPQAGGSLGRPLQNPHVPSRQRGGISNGHEHGPLFCGSPETSCCHVALLDTLMGVSPPQ
jgi:hypothetical protein